MAAARKKKAKGKPLTLDDCIKVGLGQMCLSPAAFYSMEFTDFLIAAEGFVELEENRERQNWERQRWLATVLLQPHTKKGTSLKPTDIAKFPWDKKAKKNSDNKLLANTLKNWTNA